MGIHKLNKYITDERKMKFQILVDGKYIYTSNLIYFDISYKLVNLYQKYFTINKNQLISFDGLYNYIKNELILMFKKLSVGADIVVFADYRYMKDFNAMTDAINLPIESTERLNAIPMIKRKYVPDLLHGTMKGIRCLYELKSLYNICNHENENSEDSLILPKYINLYYLLSKYGDENRYIREAINIGIYRYHVLRGLKQSSRKTHCSKSYSMFHYEDRVIGNVNRSLYNSIISNRSKLKKWNEHIPFSVITYCLPQLIQDINNPNVSFYGCLIESDFALSSYVHTYSKNSFPSIYSCDTDMICLLCDIPCAIKIDYYYFNEGIRYRESYIVNPVSFWFDVFGVDMDPIIIKTLCVLMGTDYNPYSSKSPIHIKRFEQILEYTDVCTFKDLTIDDVTNYINSKLSEYPDNEYCIQTILALGLYIEHNETPILPLKPKKVNGLRFLEYIHACNIEEV